MRLAAALALLLATPVAAQAPTPDAAADPAAEARTALLALFAQHAAWAGEQGDTLELLGATFAELPAGKVQPVRLPIEVGENYLILAACEAACTDLDLSFTDDGGTSLAAERNPDAVPAVMVSVIDARAWQANVIMVDCARPACAFGLALARRGGS